MSCCDDPTAHQPSSSETAASASALKALTSSGVTVECPDPIVAAAMLEATQLTDKEREIILGVLGRDELLRRDQQLRVLQLKAELQNLRRKGALKPTTNLDTTGPDQDPDRYCRRCRVELGRVINRGSYCRACRLKVCKACREYSLRTTDWVCTVCKKQMEIQAASGEWMNEFVKRPSKRRENRVCLPTADIIKRTIRRSWTISNPTPRWSAMRGSPEHRPYNSLPRKQDINNYPSLALYQANLKNQENFSQENPSPTYRRRSPRRTQSEDIYDDQGPSSQFRGTSPATQGGISPEMDVFNQRSSRMNPFIKLPDGRPDIERRRSPMRRSNEGSSEDGSSKEDGSPKSKGILTPETARKFDRNNMEKRVSFESHVPYTRMSRPTTVLRTQSLIEGRIQNHLPSRYPAHQEDNSDNSEEAAHGDAHDSREENNPIELCEIEPFSGTVFRKMMVRRRRQNNARNISGSTSNCSTTAENGWRRGPDSDLWDILLPEGDDYKLVFINSDGSSKEETSSREEDDNDSSSTASSFPIDECDWDYFEPGTRPAPVINWSSPFGSPRVYRRGVADSPIGSPLVYRRRMRESDTGTDEDNVRQDSGSPASSDSIFQPRIISEDPPFDSTTQLRSEKMLEDTDALRCVHSEDVSTKPCCHACGAPTQFIPIPVPVPIPFPVPTLWPPHEPPLMVFGEQRFRVLPRNLWPYLSQAALIWPALNTNGGTIGTTMPATTDRDTSALETHKEPDIEPPVVETEEEITGYLECENRYASSSDSSSDDSDNSGPRVRRMYNVSGTERHSDDALPSSNVSSDNDENDGRLSHSSVREDDMTSSGSDDTDSDDTGTVADQKSKRFSRIFVVNKNLSSSSNSCSSSSDTDTSDNDTDTELDCTVILTNVKQLEEEKDDVCDSKSSDKDTKKTENEYYFSSPGLSDVSAESVNSSDVDNNDLITKETNVISTLSKANVEKNLCKNKFNDDSRKKKVCFDDTDAVDKVTFTDEVAVIKLNKRDIEAINRENDLPFGNEFKLSQAEHFKINKDEVDDAVNENKENSSCLVKSNLTKANKKSKKTAVTFSLSEGNNNKSEEDNKTHDNIEATSDKNDEEFIVSVISGEETNSNESLTKEHLDFIAISGTTEIAVNDDNKGKTNNYSKTVLSACSTIQANILFDEQNNENLDLIISPSLTDTFGNDDVNIQNPKDFITFSTSDQVLDDNYEKIDKSTETTINDDDDYKTSFFSDSTTENLTTTDDLIVKIVKNNEDFDTDNLETITDTHILTEEQLNDYFQIFSNSTNKTSNDSDIIDNKNDDETTISALRLTARRINDNEDIETKNYDKFTKSAGSKRNDHLAEDTGDNDKDNDVEMEDIFNLDSLISNLTIENDKDVDTKSFDKLNVFSGTTTDEGAVSDDMDTTDNEGNGFINKFEIVQVTITPDSLSILDFDLIKSTINAEDVKDNIEGVVVSNDYLEESGKYGVVEELSSDIDDTTSKLNKDLNKTCDENDEKQDTIKIRETLIDGTVTSNKLDDTDTAGLEKYQDVMNLDNLVVPSSVEERRKVEYVEKSESIITTDMLLSSNELNEEINKVISKSMDNYEKVDEELKINDGTVDLNLLTTSMDKQDAKFDISSRKLADDEELDDGNEINEENDTLFDKTYTIITDNEKIETIEVDQSSLTIDKNETMLEKELTNIDETIIEDIDKLHETIAACNLIDTVMNFDSDSNEYNDDMDLPKYDTIFNAKTVKELPISQKINNTTLHSLETAEILDDSQEKAINDNVDDYIVTEYDILSFTENAENINVTDNEYYTFSSPLGASKATELFNKLPEKTSTERVDDIKATEYGTDRFSSTFGISRKAQKLDTDDDKICEYKTLSVGAPKAAQRLSKSKEKRSSERADNSGAIKYGNAMLFSAYDATKNAEKIVKPEEKISTSNIDDDIITDYEFEMLSHGTSKHAQKLSKPENNISTSEANDEFETLAHGTSTQAEKLTKSIKKIGTIEADDEFEIFTHGTSKHAQILTEIEEKIITSKADDINVTDYEFVSLSSVNPAIKNVQKFTEPQEEISNDNAGKDIVTEYECNTVSLAPKTTLEKSEEKTSIKSTDDNNAIEYALSSSPNRSQSTENVDDENATKYEFAIQSSAQGDLKNVQELTKLQEILSTDYALFLEAPKTTPRLSESQEKTNIESIDDNSAIEYDAYGASKRHQTLTKAHEEISTENADDTNGTKYEFSIHSSDKEDLQKAPRLTKLQEVISTDDSLFLGAPTTPRLSKSQQKINIGSTDDNRAIEYEYDAYGASKKPQTLTKAHEEISTENTDDNNVTKYEFAILSPDQEDLQKALKLTKHQEVISTDDALFLGAPITPRLSKSREKTNIESANDNSSIEYEYDAYGALKRPQTLTKAHDEISTENADDTNGTKDEFAIHSSDQEDLQKAPRLTKLQEVISTDDGLSLDAPKTTPSLSKSQEKTNIESTDDISPIEYEYDAYGALKRPQTLTKAHEEISTENADDTNGTKYEFAIHSSDQEGLQKAPRLTKLQEVISTDDGLSLDAPKTTPSLSKSQEKTNIESTDDISAIEYEYDAYGALKRPKTLTKVHEEISTENADDTNGTKDEFAIHSSDQEDLQKAPKLTKLQEVISTDDSLSLDAPKTTPSLSKSQEKTNIESTDDISAIEYEYDAYGSLKRPQILTKAHEEISTENADNTNGTKYEFAIHSSDQEGLQKAPRLTKLQEVISTDDGLSLDAPKTTPSLSKSQEKTNIESTDDISTIEYEYDVYGASKRPQTLTIAHGKISIENETEENVTKYELATLSLDRDDLNNAKKLTKLQEVIKTDDNVTGNEFNAFSPGAPKTTPRINKTLEKTSDKKSNVIDYEYDPLSSAYGISKTAQKLTKSQENINSDETIEFATLSLAESASKTVKRLDKSQDKPNTETVDYKNVTDDDTCSSKATQVLGKLREEIITEDTDDKNITESDNDKQKIGFEKAADNIVEFEYTLGIPKFVLKPFDTEEINIFEENDKYGNNKNAADDNVLKSDYTLFSPLDIPKETQEISTNPQDPISSEIKNSTFDKSAGEINDEFAYNEFNKTPKKFELYMLDEPRDSFERFTRAASPGVKFEIKPFDTEEINIFEENDESGQNKNAGDDFVLDYDYTISSAQGIPRETQGKFAKSQELISSERKISKTSKSADEMNKEIADDQKTKYILHSAALDFQKYHVENICKESDKFNETPKKFEHHMLDEPRDSFEKFTRVLSPGVKFELKPFDTEEINIFEENDESGQNKNSADDFVLDYDYTISSAQGIPRETQRKFAKSQELISSERKISKTSKSADEMNKEIADDEKTKYILHSAALDFQKYHVENICKESDKFNETPKKFELYMLDEPRDSFEKFTRDISLGVKFELKPFDTEEINIFEENDESGQNKNAADDFVLDYDYTISSAQGIPRETQGKFAKSQELISSERKISKTSKSADEMNKEIADDEKTKYIIHSPALHFQKHQGENICKESGKCNVTPRKFELYMLDEPRDSFERFTRAASPGVKFEIKPFDTEEINIFEENDESGQNKNAGDDFVLDYDYTISSAQGPRETQGKFAKSQELISSKRKISKTSKSADEMNKEIADDEKTKYIIHSPALDFQKHHVENICKESEKCNVTPRKFELYMLDEPRDSLEKFTRAASPGVKFELKPFDTEEINIFEENDKSGKTKNAAERQETISFKSKFSTSGKAAHEINKDFADDEKFTRAASSGVKFELKPFDTEEINIFEEKDKSATNDYAIEYDYILSSALVIPKKTQGKFAKPQEAISSERKISTTSGKSSDETIKELAGDEKTNSQAESPGVKFELKPFDIETISIFEETDKSEITVALKDLDIVKNKQDLNYSEYSNRTVIYSSFDNNEVDVSRRHEIIQSFDKSGRITDCTVDIKSDNDDDEDTFQNFDKINLAQTFKFTLRSYGEEEKNIIRDSKKPNVLEKIFKKKVKSEKDSPPQQQEIDRLINKMVEAISSEYPTDSDTDNDQLMDVVLGGETPVESAGADDQRALSEWNEIRSIDAVNVEGKSLHGRNDGVQPGAIVCGEVLSRHAARYTSLVMITQDPAPNYQQVSVVTSDTTTLVPGNDVVVRHTNWQEDDNKQLGKKRDNQNQERGSVTVITGGDTLSAFEEGLADDDSWVENLSHDEEDEDEFATNSGTEDSSSGEEVTLTCSAAIDQEEDLRGYHRAAIDFTLHTIVEESCEESEVEQNVPKKKERPASATDLEKYFFFGLGDGMGPSLQSNREDAFSETSSIYSEGMESLGSEEVQTSNDNSDPAELASSRLEKYFLSGFMGFTAERRDSDGSVGSDSEGRPSPEQRRKRLVRARGTGRSHSSSLDNLDNAISEQTIETQMSSEHSSSSDSENYDDTNSFEKPDGQFDTVKRKKNKKHKNTSSADESKNLEITQEIEEKCSDSDEDGNKTPQPEVPTTISNLTTTKNQQSRDSGFVGSCDDLLREQRDNSTPDFTSIKNELIKTELEDITEEKKAEEKSISVSTPPATSLTRKDSFNNWSSDEETNLMMCKMRQFFKTMVANSQLSASSKPSTPNLSCTIKPLPSPRAKRCKPPQLVYFENELTRLMKTVPGIREDQVKEIVEYLSSEDTWSDSYDSSDYTSSDLEITTSKTVLQQQISDSCKQIINKFDNRVDDEGDEGDGGIIDESHGLNKETAFVYQKLVASFEKMAAGENSDSNISKVAPHSSPPLIAKVMHHIGSRLVALMHEVSSGESHASNSPKTKHYHRRLQHKISSASSTTTEDDCPESAGDILGYEEHVPYNLLPRSRSHDLLVGEARILHQSTSGVSDITEEKEASDCERFSWRGSFESALLATDSRNRLSLLGGEASASASALAIAAKRRSAGDLLFSNKSLSREQLDRVRSCGSIGGANSEDKLWVASAIRPNRRRSSVPDATCGSGGSADGEDEDEDIENRSTLPRSLQGGTPTTNSLPRLPTTVSASSIQKSQSHHFLSQNVKSARYRPPGFNRLTSTPKRAVSAPGLQPSHQRRGRRSQQNNVPNELQDSNDSTLDKAVENNKIVVQNVLREWEDVLKYRVVTLLDESESTFSAVDSEEEPLELEEIVNDTEEKQEKFGKVEENICNVQDEVNFDYQQEINECSFKTDSSVNISDKKMDKEYEYQREATWFNPNIEDKTTFENEEMELHSNTDIILDQILETLVSHGVELEFQLRSHIEKIHQKISKENSTENNETQATSDTAHGSDQSVQEKLTNDILNGTEQLIPQTPNDIEEIIYEVEELLVTASNEKDELKYQITIDAIDIQETILHKQEEVGLEDLKISELQFTNSGEEVVLTSSMAGVQLTYDISSDLKPSKSGNTTSSNKIEEEFNDKHFIDENIELQATIEDGKVQKISLTGIEIKEERFEDTTDISNGLEIQISKEIKEEMEEKQDDVQTSGVVPKIIEGELKGQLSGSASGELQDSSFKSKGSKTLVRRIVHSFSPIIKCKSTNSKEEEPLLLQKEMIKSDVMSTNGPPETDKQEKNYLPNLDEFHVILETMSTVCAVQPSTTFTKNLEDEELIPEEGIDGQNEQKYIVEVNPVQEKESSKPTITISSTISKSVPEISKSSEDGNNKLPLPHKDEAGVSEAHSSPMLASPRNGTRSATTSPLTPGSKRVGHDWHHEEDLDRIVGLHGRASLSTLGARSDSMASVYSGAGEGRYGSVAVRGQVEFGLQYNYKAGALEIQIKQCKDLAPVDTKRNRSDPYVKVYLLPDKSKSGKRKTKVKKHTLNPVFDECLKFHISLNGLESRTLWLTVWHSDMFGRNDFLGEVMMTLENKVFDDPTPKWYNLQERTEPFEDVPSYRGDVIVCLKFVPPDMTIQKKGKRSRGALHVLIKEAKALTAVKANGTSDPFCKSYLLPDKGRSSKQKTPIARRTTNPVWNYTFVYDDVSLQELAERCLELTVWDHDRLASNEFLGGVRFSLGTGKHYGKPVDWMDASGREMSLWKNMLEKPNFWVEGSLSLRSSLESRGS